MPIAKRPSRSDSLHRGYPPRGLARIMQSIDRLAEAQRGKKSLGHVRSQKSSLWGLGPDCESVL